MVDIQPRSSLPIGLPPQIYISFHQLAGDIKKLQKTINFGILMKLAIQSRIETPNLGVAKLNVGPPINLNPDYKREWEVEIHNTYLRLIKKFILPDLECQINNLKGEVKSKLVSLSTSVTEEATISTLMSNLRQRVDLGQKLTIQKLIKLHTSFISRTRKIPSFNLKLGETDITSFLTLPWFPAHTLTALDTFVRWIDSTTPLPASNSVINMGNRDIIDLSTPNVIDLSPSENTGFNITPKANFSSPSVIDLLSPCSPFDLTYLEGIPMLQPDKSVTTTPNVMGPVTSDTDHITTGPFGLVVNQSTNNHRVGSTITLQRENTLPDVMGTPVSKPVRPVLLNLHNKMSKVYAIHGDGNCLFRSLALGILETQIHHFYIRTKISIFLARHEARFVPFFYPEKIPGAKVIPKTFSQYVDLLSSDGVYGGALEITAAAEIWSIGIWVFDDTDKLHSVWDELNDSYICLRYTLLHKHYELVETLGKSAYHTLLLNRDRKLKMLSNTQMVIDLSTPEVTIKSTPRKAQSDCLSIVDGPSITPVEHDHLIKKQSTTLQPTKFTSSDIRGHFPIPSHDTPLRKPTLGTFTPQRGNRDSIGVPPTPLHFDRSHHLPFISEESNYHSQIDVDVDKFISQLKSMRGKKRRTIYNLIREFFRNQRTHRKKRKQYSTRKSTCNAISQNQLFGAYEEGLSPTFSFTTNTQQSTGDQSITTPITNKSRTLAGLSHTAAKKPMNSTLESSIFNFSSHTLGLGEVNLLTKGLSFSPSTNVINTAQVQIDLFKFCRNVRLKKYFETHPYQASSSKHVLDSSFKFQMESSFDPESTCKFLNTYLDSVRFDINSLLKSKLKTADNLHPLERLALTSLRNKINNKELTVVSADKGSGIVILDYDKYKSKGDLYFEDNKDSYKLVTNNETGILKSLLKARSLVIKKLFDTKTISAKHKRFTQSNLNTKITGIKFLFKIHKSLHLDSIPLRPIHPSIGSPNHNLSLLLDALINPFVNEHTIPTLLRDTNQLLFFLRNLGSLPPDVVLATSDIASLYTNIPHGKGVEILTQFLTKYSTYKTPNITAIAHAVKHVVSLNFLKWQNLLYQQIRGVAMGTPLAVSYANIFMGAVDESLKTRAPFIISHFRFIDDNLFLVPTNKVSELRQLSDNPEFPTIKSTWTVDFENKGISFLDVWISIKENAIHTRLFTKPTDKHLYLHPSSYHPKHIISNIPYSILSRVRRLCSDEQSYLEDKSKTLQWLRDRGYKSDALLSTVTRVESQTGWQHILAIEEKHRGNLPNTNLDTHKLTVLPLILTFNTKLKKAPFLLYQHKRTLASTLKQPHRPLVAFRRNKNLTDLLVHPSYRKHIQTSNDYLDTQSGFHQCKKTLRYRLNTCICGVAHSEGCRVCAHSVDGLSRVPGTKVKVLLHQFADCHTKNVVYAIWCRACTKIYVGETTQPLSRRFDQHLRMMRAHTTTETLYQHFRNHHPSNAFIVPLEVVRKLEPKLLQIKEGNWINKLGSLVPNGLNTQLDLDQKYKGEPLYHREPTSIFTPTPARARVDFSSPVGRKRLLNEQDRVSPGFPKRSKSNHVRVMKKTPEARSQQIRVSGGDPKTPSKSNKGFSKTSHYLDVNSETEPFIQISPYVYNSHKRKGRCCNLSTQRIPLSPLLQSLPTLRRRKSIDQLHTEL